MAGPILKKSIIAIDSVTKHIIMVGVNNIDGIGRAIHRRFITDGKVMHPNGVNELATLADILAAINVSMPAGSVQSFAGDVAPTGWFLCNGALKSRATESNLFAVTNIRYNDRFTVVPATDIFTATAHGFVLDDPVTLWSKTSLPAPLIEGTIYYARDITADTFKLAASAGGAAIGITTTGSSPQTIAPSATFALPDARGRVLIGVGSGAGLTTRELSDAGGEEDHQLTTAELASHVHAATVAAANTIGGQRGTMQPLGAPNQNTNSTGGDTAHNTMQPFIALNCIIKN